MVRWVVARFRGSGWYRGDKKLEKKMGVAVIVVKSNGKNKIRHFVVFSQYSRVLERILEDSFLDGGEDQSDIRSIGCLSETVAEC